MSEGVVGFTAGDMVIPEFVMVQNTTREVSGLVDAKTGAAAEQLPGLIVDKKNKESYGKKLDVVLLQVTKKRTLWYDKKKEPGKQGKKCFSSDGIRPSANAAEPQSKLCEDCEYSFKDIEYHMLMLDVERSLETGSPVLFRFMSKGTSNGPTRSLVSSLLKRKDKNIRDFRLVFGSAKDSNAKGNFVIASYTNVTPVEDELLQSLVEQAYLTYCDKSGGATEDVEETQEDEVPF